jgi:hypothetical protein
MGEKIGVFYSKQSLIMQKFDHNIGFWEKRHFVRRRLAKIALNCDHNIDPKGCQIFAGTIYQHGEKLPQKITTK